MRFTTQEKRWQKKARFVCFLGLISVLLSACGGADDEDDGDQDPGGETPVPTLEPSATPTTTPTPTPDSKPDNDNDGVIDEQDQCPDTPESFVVDEQGCPLFEKVGDCSMSDEEKRMIVLHNEARAVGQWCGGEWREPVAALRWDCRLATAARLHSEDMATNNFFSHVGSNGSAFSDRISAQGYRWSGAAENIIAGYGTVERSVQGWLDSDGHCHNMMTNYKDMGAGKGVPSGEGYSEYWTSNFASSFDN